MAGTNEERVAEFERRLARLMEINGGGHDEPPLPLNAMAENALGEDEGIRCGLT
jgi:hypothetical protein